jgi:tetratricopeptide (TPR) repeat protein
MVVGDDRSLAQLLGRALELHRQGDLEQAEAQYLELLAMDANYPDALHLLGVLKGQLGDLDGAVTLIERAIANNSHFSSYHNNLGNVLGKLGQQRRAKKSYQRALKLDEKNADACVNLGRLLQDEGEIEDARSFFVQAVRISPRSVEGHMSMGRLEEATGDRQASIVCFLRAAEIAPEYAPAYLMIGKCWCEAGDLNQAEINLRRAIDIDPGYADAYFNLGGVEQARRRLPEAAAAYRRAIALSPLTAADACNNLGLVLSEMGERQSAISAYLQAITLNADFEADYFQLSKEEIKSGDNTTALELLHKIIELNPKHVEACHSLGAIYDGMGRSQEAIHLYRQGVEAGEPSSNLLSNLGRLLARQSDPEGIALLEQVLRRQPHSAEAHFHLAVALLEQGTGEENWDDTRAREIFLKVVALNPKHCSAYHNLGALAERQGLLEEAIQCYRAVAEIIEPSRNLLLNLGGVMALQGDANGIVMLQELVRQDPLWPEAHFNLANALLLHGRYDEGWPEYEWGRKVDQLKPHYQSYSQEHWNGEPLDGRSILVYSEQGLGDTLQFVRYLPLVQARGGRVILEAQPHLRRLLGRIPGVVECIAQDDPLPPFDRCISLMSLPRIFNTTTETIPAPLSVPLEGTSIRTKSKQDRYRVGLVWAGNPKHQRDRLRSLALASFHPLVEVDEIDFIALQTGPAAAQIAEDGRCFGFVGDCSAVKDFADTAEIVSGLDMVITIDSAVAHLAGSMGRPVWILVPNVPDWRWGLESTRTAWYPSARLFRQKTPGDWQDVITEIVTELRRVVRDFEGRRDGLPEFFYPPDDYSCLIPDQTLSSR